MVKYVIREAEAHEDEEQTVELYLHQGSDGLVSVKAGRKGGEWDQFIFTFREDGSVRHWNHLSASLGLKLGPGGRVEITD